MGGKLTVRYGHVTTSYCGHAGRAFSDPVGPIYCSATRPLTVSSLYPLLTFPYLGYHKYMGALILELRKFAFNVFLFPTTYFILLNYEGRLISRVSKAKVRSKVMKTFLQAYFIFF